MTDTSRKVTAVTAVAAMAASLALASCSSEGSGAMGSRTDGGGGGSASSGGQSSAAGNSGGGAAGGSVASGGAAGAKAAGGTTSAGGAAGASGGTAGASGGTTGSGPDASAPRGGCKRGVAYGFDPASAPADVTVLSSGVSWFYGWSTKPSSAVAAAYAGAGVEFVPMVWGGNFNVDKVVSEIPAGAKYLLGFNEPNFYSQANLTPTEAAALWPQLEEIATRRNLSLVSPAINYCGGGCNVTNPFDWMDQFFAACTSCRIDYVAVHWYACSQSALSGYIDGFKKYGKPIWLTEFSCGDQGVQPVSKQQSYMKDALAYLEGNPDIFRYAWFSGRTTAIQNVDLLAAGGVRTALGDDYVSLPQAAACTR